MTGHVGDDVEGPIRETYEEYDLGTARIAMIADPDNDEAWIQSDVTEPVVE